MISFHLKLQTPIYCILETNTVFNHDMLFEAPIACKLNVAFSILHLIVTTMMYFTCAKHPDSL